MRVRLRMWQFLLPLQDPQQKLGSGASGGTIRAGGYKENSFIALTTDMDGREEKRVFSAAAS